MLNTITIHGRLVRDPEMKTTQNGISVCNLTVAVDRSFARQGEERQTDFFYCTCWRGLADMVGKHFSKGKEILLTGEMQSRQYTDKDGNNRTAWEIQIATVDFCGSKSATPNRGDADDTEDIGKPQSDFTVVNSEELPF